MVSTKALRLGYIADSEREGGTPPGLLQLLPNGAGMPFHLRYQRQQKKWEKKKKGWRFRVLVAHGILEQNHHMCVGGG